MNILLCSKRDFTSVILLNDLFRRFADMPDLRVKLFLAERTRGTETLVPELSQMKFFERDLPFGVFFPLLDALPQNPVDADLLTLDALVARHGVSTKTVTSLKSAETLAEIDAFKPDLILSMRFSFIFGEALIQRPRHGVINVHPGRLPEFAGLYPHFHSMIAGQDALGCTVHRVVDRGIDTGPVIAAGETPIDPQKSAFAHNLDSHLVGNALVTDIVARLRRGEKLEGVAQDMSRAAYNTYPTPEQFQAFRKAGFSLIKMNEYMDLLRRFGAPAARAAEAFAAPRSLVALTGQG